MCKMYKIVIRFHIMDVIKTNNIIKENGYFQDLETSLQTFLKFMLYIIGILNRVTDERLRA